MNHVYAKWDMKLIILQKNVLKFAEMEWLFKFNVMMEILIIMMDAIKIAKFNHNSNAM